MSFHAINRRTFLKTASTAAAVSLLPSRFLWAAGEHKIKQGRSAALHRPRSDEGRLRRHHRQGRSDRLQGSGICRILRPHRRPGEGGAREEWSQGSSTHVQYDELEDKFPSVIEFSKADRSRIHRLSLDSRRPAQESRHLEASRGQVQQGGEQTKKAGMQFGYHNHWFEFLPTDGKLPYDELLKLCDANLVKMEMDLVLDHRRRGRSGEVLRSISRTLPARPRQRRKDNAQGDHGGRAELRQTQWT